MNRIDKDYSKYSFSKLLNFLEEGYLHDTEKKNYAQLLLEMRSVNSIEQLLKVYDSVFIKIPDFIYMVNYKPEYWHHYNCWAGYKSYLAEELNLCLNENILRLFQESSNKTKDMCLSCIANLRIEKQCEDIQGKILLICEEEIEPDIIKDISEAREKTKNFCVDAWPYHIGTNGFDIAKTNYLEAKNTLKSFGYVESVVARRSEMEVGIMNNNFLGTQNNDNSSNVIITIVLIVILIIAIIIISKIGLFGIMILVVGIPAALKAAKII